MNRRLVALHAEVEYLDKLIHLLHSLTKGKAIDSETFKKFTKMIRLINLANLPANVQKQMPLLIEAGQQEDAQKILELLPAFYDAFKKRHDSEEVADSDKIEKIMSRLKKALQEGDINTAKPVLTEFGEVWPDPSDDPTRRKLDNLVDLFGIVDDSIRFKKIDEALEAIHSWEKIKNGG
jgi:hypothetical protein